MRLEKIILNGFKSFADKTDFVFDCPITAIVGPNGCGKSNVVDAVKWVLGEQSVKSLRSGHMADVIFGGSSSRKPLGAAEVSLFISNPEGTGTRKLPIDAEEIQITRKIYKSGESEYRINNKICRLKDIRELFMDTGIGTRAYSILEQGQIEYLVSASKTDRRFIFEEAAGISKYKAHKKEALRKLERTEQNLLRLADILGEIAKRLRSVKLQAGKARNYLQYTQRLKELQVSYSLVEYAKNRTQMKDKGAVLDEVSEQFGRLAAEVAQQDSLVSTLGEEIIETEHKLSQTDNSLVSVRSKIEQHLQRIDFLRARISELQEREQSAREKIEKLREQKKQFEQNSAQYISELANCEKMLEEKSGAVEQIQKAIQEVNAECTSLEAHLEDEKSGIIDIVRRTAQLHNEVQSISVYRNNLSSQKDRLAGRAETARAELERLLTEKAQHNARHDDIEKVLGELKESLESKRSKSEELNEALVMDNKRLAHSKEVRSALNSELTILTDMEKRREGLKAGVKSILQERAIDNKFDYVEGILAETIETGVEYANAVEAALEGQTDALVINSTGRMLADIERIRELDGRVNFISLDKVEPFVDTNDWSGFECVKGRLVEFVKFDSKYAALAWKLLGKTLVVESLQEAVELANSVPDEFKFVTLRGEFLSGDGMIKLGPLGKASGLISRKSRLRQLQETIGNIASEIEGIESQIAKNNQTKAHLDELCKDLRTAVYEAHTEKMQVGSKLSLIEQNIQRLRQEEPLLASEIDMLAEQIAQSVQKEYDSKQKLEELEEVNNQRTAHIEELEAKYSEQKEQQQILVNKLTDLKVALGQVSEQSKALKQITASLQSQIQENRAAAETAQNEIKNCSEQLAQAQRDILDCEAGVSELFVEKEKNQECSRLLHKEVERLLVERKKAEELIRLRRAEKEETDRKINELKIELSQLEVRQQDLIERVQEQLQIDLAEAYEDYSHEDVDWDKVKEEITELREKIERLGNVNIDAIDEQETLEKRHDFLSEQVHDLNSSRGQLQQLISRLNKKSREKFQQTFEEIRGHFQEIFRKLFGGGKADIMLEDAEDILEAGIEVIARPPGKETRSISLLSGGEKSMTALALLFSVFKTKPSPFCFLDEVDAALDEANNERFNMLLREFQKESQFIVITHAKRTMSIADVLFGITMQIRGVSKKISVKFGEHEEETAAVA
ncbi:MAG: chromosome segregation protein SMC [Planctomycetes bacterium]|nr:chromosome segregation protein SMC [Planctomycetota bacterium]MBL7145227.1 chromosome segregation protein SMC [Phycisphaerae bacterium]